MDEARVGQKGRTGFRGWLKGERPRGLCDRGFEWAYIYGAVRPATGEDFGLVLPAVSTALMSFFLTEFAKAVPADTPVVLLLDQAGWHGSGQLCVPDCIGLVPRPSSAPELNPVERIWPHLREHHLSHRVLVDYDALLTACCEAWNSLTAERLRSLCNFPWIAKVTS